MIKTPRCLLISLLWTAAVPAFAGEQVITPNPAVQQKSPNQAVSFEVLYSTANPVDETLNGLGLKMYFNSSQLAFNTVANPLATDFIAAGTPVADSTNGDGDAATDQFVLVAWASIQAGWPGVGNTPTALYTAHFTSTADFTSTQVNFGAATTAPGYTLAPTSVTLTSH